MVIHGVFNKKMSMALHEQEIAQVEDEQAKKLKKKLKVKQAHASERSKWKQQDNERKEIKAQMMQLVMSCPCLAIDSVVCM